MTVMGIDLSASEKRNSGVCLLVNLKAKTFLARLDDELVGLAMRFRPKLIAIDAPLSLPAEGSSSGFRLCDLELLRRGIRILPLNFGAMRELTERGIRLKERLELEGFKVIEVFPGGAQDVLGLPRKQKDLTKLKEGLKQLGLEGIEPDVSHDEVDAVTAAFVGWLWLNGFAELVSDGQGGGIVMPLPYPLKFMEGVRLYRKGYYWHAHEEWEEVWRNSGEPERSFLKGLIQIAAALIQCGKGKWKGAMNLLARAQRNLSQCPNEIYGTDIANLQRQVESFRNEVEAILTGLKTHFNWQVKPRLEPRGMNFNFRERFRRSKADLPEKLKGRGERHV